MFNYTFNGFSWGSGNHLVDFGLGLALVVCCWAIKVFYREEITYEEDKRRLFLTLFFIGIIVLLFKHIDITINNGFLLLAAYLVNLMTQWIFHRLYLNEIEDDTSRIFNFGPFKRYEKRADGTIISYKFRDIGNAFSTRFGLHIIGTGSFWRALTGWGHGLSERELKGKLYHERGHTIFAPLTIFLETYILYAFFTNITWVNFIVLIPALMAALTLLAWVGELLADTVCGIFGFAALKEHIESSGYFNFGTGWNAHPPIILRVLAFMYLIPLCLIIYVLSFFVRG